MKAKLIFDLNDVDDRTEYKIHNQANNMYSALWQITHNLKKEMEREIDHETFHSQQDLLDAVFNKITEECHELNLEL